MRRIVIAYLWILAITNIYGMETEKVDPQQENNSMVVETTSSSSSTPKRSREEGRGACDGINPLYVEDIFCMVSTHLDFEDRVTGLGATSSTFRHWTIKEIINFSDQFEYDLVNISLNEYLEHLRISLVKVSPQEFLQQHRHINHLYPGSEPTNYILKPNIFSREHQVYLLLKGKIKKKIPANFIIELTNEDTRSHKVRYCIKRNINKEQFIFRSQGVKCLRLIPMEFRNLFVGCSRNEFNDHSNHDLEKTNLNPNKYLKIFTNLEVLDLRQNTVITDDTLSFLTNLRKLSLRGNQMITSNSLKYLTKLKELNLKFNEIITDEVLMKLTNLLKLNLIENGIITDHSVRYLTNLTSIKISMDTHVDDEYRHIKVFGPMLETLPKLKRLYLDTYLPFNYENLFGLTNLTSLEINERLGELRQTPNKGRVEYNLNIIKFMIWEHLPNLEWYSYTSDRFEFSETRKQFTQEQKFRTNLIENINKEQPNNLLETLRNIHKLDLMEDEVIIDNVMNYTNLKNITDNGIVTAPSIKHLRSLKEIKISIDDPLEDEPTDDEHFCLPLLAPIMGTLSNLEYLNLDTRLPFNYEHLFGLFSLTRLEIRENLGCKYSTTLEGNFEYNLNIINSMLWERLPKLGWYSYTSDHHSFDGNRQHKFSENRDQFNAKKALRKKLLENTKQENPYCSWKEINEKVEAELNKQIGNNG